VPDAERIVEAFEHGRPSRELIDQVVAASDPVGVVQDLSRSDDAEVRAWVVHALSELIVKSAVSSTAASALLIEIADGDRDSDLRDDAASALAEIDPDAARRLVPQLVKRLRSDDYFAPIAASWLLASLGANAHHNEVDAYATRAGEDRWQGRQARIVAALMRGDENWLATRIDEHDHDMMHALCRAARIMRRPALRPPLRNCADRFDDECRRFCSETLPLLSGEGSSGPELGERGRGGGH